MGRGANGSPPVLDVVLDQWPLLLFVPAVLLLVAALAGVTRWWDRKDEAHVAEKRVADRTVRATWRPRLRRRAACTCSWHGVGAEGG